MRTALKNCQQYHRFHNIRKIKGYKYQFCPIYYYNDSKNILH